MTTTESKTQVAETIAQQIGNGALYMLGATGSLMAGERDLQFKVRGSRKVNMVRVVLNGHDLYNVEGWKGRGVNIRLISMVHGVGVERLRDTISNITGLAVSL